MLVTAFEASSEVPKIEIVTERLLNEEKKIKEKRTSSSGLSGEALFTNSRQKAKVCFYCGEAGHIKIFCEKYKRSIENDNKENKPAAVANFSAHGIGRMGSNRKRSDSESSDECLALVSDVVEMSKKTWIVDSAASRHMCKDRKMFQNVRRLRYPKNVKIGDGSIIKARFQGTIKLQIRSVNKVMKFKMRNVLYVPELKYNLLSVSQASECGKIIQFDKFGAKINDASSGETVGTATKMGELYKINIIDNVETRNKKSSPRRTSSDTKRMEQALLSVKENNFSEEIMKRLDRIEEDKLKLNERLNTVEEDISYTNQSYTVIKEDYQNSEVSQGFRESDFFEDVESEVSDQEDNYEESEVSDQEDNYEEPEVSDQEDNYEGTEVSDQEDNYEGTEGSDREDSNENYDEDDRESLSSKVINSLLYSDTNVRQVFHSSEFSCNEENKTHKPSNARGGKLKKRLVSLKKHFMRLFRS